MKAIAGIFGFIWRGLDGVRKVLHLIVLLGLFLLIGAALSPSIPIIPAKGGAYVLSLIGGIGGSLTLLSYNYLLRDDKKVGPANLRSVRMDLAHLPREAISAG